MICVYPPDCTDFSTNGDGALSPISCEVREVLNGEYEVTLVHPIDDTGKWQRLTVGSILRAPVPIGTTPYVYLPDTEIKVDKSTRGVWRITSSCHVRGGPDTSYKIIGTYQNPGVAVAVLGSVYTATLTSTVSGVVIKRYYSSYPTDPVPEGYTRTIAMWYKVSVKDGSTGYTQGGISNTYYSQDIETIIGETVEEKQYRDQPFRIYRIVPEMDKITVYARHVFYDLLDYMVKLYEAGENDRFIDALRGIIETAGANEDFAFYSDIADIVKGYIAENKNPLEAILGDEGLISQYGGELCRDWFDVYVVNHIGKDRNVQIREGKNLLGISYDVDATDVVTRIMPTGQTKNGETLYLPELYIDSENIDAYPHPKWIHLDVQEAKIGSDGVANQTQAFEKMRAAAQAEFDNGCDQPAATLKVDFLNMYDTEDYKQYAFLQNIFLGDSVGVMSSSLGISVIMRMTEYTYDCLELKYTAMSLGTVSATIGDSTISARQIPSGSITSAKIANGAIGTSQLQNGSIQSAKIDVAAIETAHIQNAAITTATIADAAITNTKIENAAVDTAKIADAAITAAKIANASIRTAHIIDGTITNAKIGDAEIGTAKIALGAITSALIQNGAVGTLQIADGSITAAKVVSLNADVITTGTLSVKRLILVGDDGLIYEINAAASGLTPQQLTDDEYKEHLNGTVIVAKSITAAQIAAQTITANEILSGTITSEQINCTELVASEAFITQLNVQDITSNQSLRITINTLHDEASNAMSVAQEASNVTSEIGRYITFDVEGLRQSLPDSIYSTLIDELGFHIDKENTVGHIASFSASDGLGTDSIVVGLIKCRKSSRGGWVWQEV